MAIADVSNRAIADLISLAGRRAVVTGGAQGLGKAIAARLAEAGAEVMIVDLQQPLAEAAAAELSSTYGVRVRAARMDVTDATSVAAVADRTVADLGGLDIWVNNAGIFPNVLLPDLNVDVWDQVMAINLRGMFLGSQQAARRMTDAGRGGVIINIASAAGFRGGAAGMSAYTTSKHGVVGMTRQMAVELAPRDIRVLGVAPTYCVTEGTTAAQRISANEKRDLAKELPQIATTRLGRVGVPDDIGRVVLFCASDLSVFMTGSTLLVDAGETA